MKKGLDIGLSGKMMYGLYKSSQISSRIQYGLDQLENKFQIEYILWEPFTVKGPIFLTRNSIYSIDLEKENIGTDADDIDSSLNAISINISILRLMPKWEYARKLEEKKVYNAEFSKQIGRLICE